LGMVNVGKDITRDIRLSLVEALRLRMPPFQAVKSNLTDYYHSRICDGWQPQVSPEKSAERHPQGEGRAWGWLVALYIKRNI